MDKFGKLCLYLICLIAAYIIDGLVIKCLWGWYAEPLGLISISLVEAIGLGILINFLTYPTSIMGKLYFDGPDKTGDGYEEAFFGLMISVILAIAAVIVGGIVHLFV